MRSSLEEAMSLLSSAEKIQSSIRICAVDDDCLFVIGGRICELNSLVLDIRGAEARFFFAGMNKATFEYSDSRELPKEFRETTGAAIDFTLRVNTGPKSYFLLCALKNG